MGDLNMAELAIQLFSLLSPVLTAGVGWLGLKLSQLVAAKTHSQMAGSAILALNDAVTTVVTDLENTMVQTAKQRTGSGQLTQADADAIKQAAVAKVKSYMGPTGINLLLKAFGLDGSTVDGFIGSKVESAVYAVSNGANPTLPSASNGNGAGGAVGNLPPFLSGPTPDNPYGGAVADPGMSRNNVPVPAYAPPMASPVAQAINLPLTPTPQAPFTVTPSK